jgi:hypothetical protein
MAQLSETLSVVIPKLLLAKTKHTLRQVRVIFPAPEFHLLVTFRGRQVDGTELQQGRQILEKVRIVTKRQ